MQCKTYFLVNLYWDNKYSDSDSKELAQKWAAATHTLKKEKEKNATSTHNQQEQKQIPFRIFGRGWKYTTDFFQKGRSLKYTDHKQTTKNTTFTHRRSWWRAVLCGVCVSPGGRWSSHAARSCDARGTGTSAPAEAGTTSHHAHTSTAMSLPVGHTAFPCKMLEWGRLLALDTPVK